MRTRNRLSGLWIFGVGFPAHRVVLNVGHDALQRSLVSNDVFIEAPLPDGHAGRAANFIDAVGRGGFEGAHPSSERFLCRGGSRPARSDIGDGNNSMQMIRHHDPRFRILPDAKHRAPNPIDDRPRWVQDHLAVVNFAKQRRATIDADGYEIQPLGGIVVSVQADSSTSRYRGVHFTKDRSRFRCDDAIGKVFAIAASLRAVREPPLRGTGRKIRSGPPGRGSRG
jgi:hypothetical protein